MRKISNIVIGISLGAALFIGCVTTADPNFQNVGAFGADTPVNGVHEYPAPGYSPITEIGSKTGIACASTQPGLFGATVIHGDNSIVTAARLGQITQIKSVHYREKIDTQFLGVWGTYKQICTVVTGE